jgi:hypothetical protein
MCNSVRTRVARGGCPSNECVTLYTLVMTKARLDSTVLVSGWSDNGWLSGGHAVRMALELCECPKESSYDRV